MRQHLLVVILTAALTLPTNAQSAGNEVDGVDIDFPGGTAEAYVETIRKAAPGVNIVIMPGLEKVSLPPIHLRNVGLESALWVLENQRFDGGSVLDVDRNGGPGGSVYAIRVQAARRSQADPSGKLVVISVADVLESGVSADDLLSAVEAAMQMINANSEAMELKFHQATGLIFARGQQDQVGLIFEIVDQLRIGTENRSMHQQQALEREAAMAELRDMEMQMHASQVEREEITRHAMQSVAELDILRKQFETVKAELAEYRAAMKDAKRQIELLETELARTKDER